MFRALVHTLRWLLPLCGAALVILAWIVSMGVEDEVRREAADAAGIPEARVELVDGLDVRLVGFADEGARDRAVTAVAALAAVDEVEGVLALSEPAGPERPRGAAAPSTTTTTASAPLALRPPSVSVTFTIGGLRLDGAADPVLSDALFTSATERFGPDRVEDAVTLDPAASAPSGTLVLVGVAGSEAQRRDWALDGAAVARVVGLEVDDQLTVGTTVDVLNALFALRPIEFDPGASTLRPSSALVLDEAATFLRLEGGRDGRLRVAGHTDTDGDPDENRALSLERARAVVDYLVAEGGVDPRILAAIGRGESEPLIEPELTADDKQRNRRIEWEPLR